MTELCTVKEKVIVLFPYIIVLLKSNIPSDGFGPYSAHRHLRDVQNKIDSSLGV